MVILDKFSDIPIHYKIPKKIAESHEFERFLGGNS